MTQLLVYDNVTFTLDPGQTALQTTVTIPEPIWSYQLELQAFWDAGGTIGHTNVYSNAACFAFHHGFTQPSFGFVGIDISTATSGGWVRFATLTNSSSAGGTSVIIKWNGERNYNVCVLRGNPDSPSTTYLSQTVDLRVSVGGSATAAMTVTGLTFGFTDEAEYNIYPSDCWGGSGPPTFWGGLNPVAVAGPRLSSDSGVSAPLTSRARSWALVVG